MEIIPGIHQLKIPIPNNPLFFINSYLIKADQGCMLIDTGWNTDEAFEALTSQLAEVDVSLSDLKYIAVTHIHPDHYGLVGRLEKHTQASLIVHGIEQSLLNSRYMNYDSLLEEMGLWLKINGVPKEIMPTLQRASLEVQSFVDVAFSDHLVHGGEHFSIGDYDLEVVWTPGHSPGHICFYEHSHKLLFSGDHVLKDTTPNVSMHSQSISNPLVDYLNSLQQVAQLDVDLVLPGHGDVFTDLQNRVKEIEQHHEKRLREMLNTLNGVPKTAFNIAQGTTWYMPWEELPSYSKRMAVTETLAHLELLLARDILTKNMRDGIFWYSGARHVGT